jgi:hypothetical protein
VKRLKGRRLAILLAWVALVTTTVPWLSEAHDLRSSLAVGVISAGLMAAMYALLLHDQE